MPPFASAIGCSLRRRANSAKKPTGITPNPYTQWRGDSLPNASCCGCQTITAGITPAVKLTDVPRPGQQAYE
jgi:hypothetical protein